MKIEEIKIIDNKLILPKRLLRILKWKYPFYKIPDLNEYSQRIINFSKENNQLPFYSKFDINNDGNEEIMIIHKSVIGGHGRLLIISLKDRKFKFDRIKWNRPVNSLFFDYLIEQAPPKKYKTLEYIFRKNNHLKIPEKIIVNHPHIVTKGYLRSIVYWNGEKYCQEKVSSIDGETKVIIR
jgi:hypothetical protein